MRRAFGELLADLAELDDDIILIVGDIGFGIFDKFRKKFGRVNLVSHQLSKGDTEHENLIHSRFINWGIREQSMVSFASGLALQGVKPYVYTITPFLIERAFEQIKLDIDQQCVNVKLVGYADYPDQGPTHAELNPVDTFRGLKNIVQYYPRNSQETIDAVQNSYHISSPAFISLKKDRGN